MRRMLALIAASCLAASVLGGCASPLPAAADATSVSARTLLAGLDVRAEDYGRPYDRSRFGYGPESDADGDGCSTRKEVLIRDALSIDRISRYCAVYGTWRSLYDDRRTSDPSTLEIDHLIPLAEAWHAGASRWSHRRQVAFGNDLGYRWSLLPVTAALNQGEGAGKGDKEPGEWLPPKHPCAYLAAWIAVKYRWKLTVDPVERRALTRGLDRCGPITVLRPGEPDLATLVGR